MGNRFITANSTVEYNVKLRNHSECLHSILTLSLGNSDRCANKQSCSEQIRQVGQTIVSNEHIHLLPNMLPIDAQILSGPIDVNGSHTAVIGVR